MLSAMLALCLLACMLPLSASAGGVGTHQCYTDKTIGMFLPIHETEIMTVQPYGKIDYI